MVRPLGPHQCTRCSGSVHTFHTRSRGASNVRVMVNVSSLDGLTFCRKISSSLPSSFHPHWKFLRARGGLFLGSWVSNPAWVSLSRVAFPSGNNSKLAMDSPGEPGNLQL